MTVVIALAQKNTDNPKRSYGYAVGIIEKKEDVEPRSS